MMDFLIQLILISWAYLGLIACFYDLANDEFPQRFWGYGPLAWPLLVLRLGYHLFLSHRQKNALSRP